MADDSTREREGTFGSYIPDEILDQIELRQNIHGRVKGYSEEAYQSEYHNAPWVCLRSSVDVPKDGTYKPGTKPPTDDGALAKQYVLCGGTMEVVKGEDGKSKLVFVSDNHLGVAGYGYDGTYGYRPRPGITKVTVKTKDTFGCIMEATIEFTVYSLEDLEAVDKLYFKPGMSALLEWGHSVYVLNNGTAAKITKPKLFDLDSFFNTKDSYEDINKKLQNWRADIDDASGKRKSAPQFDGNYEAMFGLITNFSWSFNNDGSYACTVKLLSQGTILEGLQVPASVGLDLEKLKAGESYTDLDLTTVGAALVTVSPYTSFAAAYNKNLRENIAYSLSGEDREYRYKSSFHYIFDGILGKVRDIDEDNKSWKPFKDEPCTWPGGQTEYYSFWGKRITDKENPNAVLAYIKLNDLLRIFNQIFKAQAQNLNIGFTRFETRDDENYSEQAFTTFPEHFSLRPNEVLLPFRPTTSKENYSIKVNLGDKKQEQELYVQYILNNFATGQETSLTKDQNRIGDIMVEVNFILKCLDSVLDSSKGTYNVRDFLDNIITGIQLALGNINDFGIHINHATETASIVDRKCISHNLYTTEQKPIIVSGPKTTLTDLKITSEVSSEIATEMSVAATAPADGKHIDKSNPNQVFWNEGCVDRHRMQDTITEEQAATAYQQSNVNMNQVYSTSVGIGPVLPPRTGENKTGVFSDAGDFFTRAITLYDVLNRGEDSSKTDWSTIQQDGQTLFNSCLVRDLVDAGQNTAAQSQSYLQAGVIPIKIGFTMKGIGRFVIGTTFKISQGLVPKKYRDWRQLITGVEHTIDKSGWKTTVSALYYPVLPNTQGNIRPILGTNELAWDPKPMLEATGVITNASSEVRAPFIAPQPDSNGQLPFFATYWAKRIPTKGVCAKYVADMAKCWVNGQNQLDVPNAARGGFGNADSLTSNGTSLLAYNLQKIGWTNIEEPRRGISFSEAKKVLAKATKPGDIVIYYTNPKSEYRHAQMRTTDGWSSNWTTSFMNQYSDFVYEYTSEGKLNPDVKNYKWDIYILRAPKRNSDWQ